MTVESGLESVSVLDWERLEIMGKIEAQTKALASQLKKLESIQEDDDEQYIKELEKYNTMLKNADFSPEAQAASKKKKLNIADKVLVPPIKWATKQVKKIDDKVIARNNRGKS